MRLTSIELSGFKSFAKKTPLEFASAITAIVGPNGSGKSNVAESFRFVLGEQSMKSMRGRKGEDLIWNGSPAVPRAGRAGVKLVFDNSDRVLNLDFDEVSLERVVYRDGRNDYLLNGSQVRLRDIQALLSQANIGASGHHIISQGEADRILSAGSRERREMIEDALGLTGYLYKREEAERKLEKTGENVREVEALRRELTPHLKFLQAQVKKIEETKKLRDTLALSYLEYLKRESLYLELSAAHLASQKDEPESALQAIEKQIEHLRHEIEHQKTTDKTTGELMRLEEEERTATRREGELSRELGRLEGEMRAREGLSKESVVPASQARDFGEHVIVLAEGSKISEILSLAREFLHRLSALTSGFEDLTPKKQALERELSTLTEQKERTRKAVEALRKKIESEKDASRHAERDLFEAMTRRSELASSLSQLRAKEEILAREKADFTRELAEAGALLGSVAATYASYKIEDGSEEEGRTKQEERRRKLERMKIRLEESGVGSGEEILKEYTETSERDQFLARELEDLAASQEKLRHLIGELTTTLESRFGEGIEKINTEFDTFFKLMFGGGSASLQTVKEQKIRRGALDALEGGDIQKEDEEEVEEGIDITVSLPHKRIRGLHMLSGGERALTSIALIFAMSQVNPPPFLILDETDAALDEANSRRYGDMIKNLSKKSQLILITHNRETMSRAGVLYGVTMGSDGASKLLSVKFEEALAVAK